MIELCHITAGYGGEAVLRDFSVRFSPGKITGILGRNGCGKSTLLKTAAGLLRPMSGEVLVDGRPLGDYAPKELARQIAVLPQSREVPAITVESLVMHGLSLSGIPPEAPSPGPAGGTACHGTGRGGSAPAEGTQRPVRR